MRIVFICAACLLAPVLVAQSTSCRTIEGDQILARDLAGAIGAFTAVPPATVVALAPLPGAQRTLKATEILSLARKSALPLEVAHDVCFAWRMEPLNRDRVLEVMHRSLGIPQARIELIELSNYPVPHGELDFDLRHLGVPARTDRLSPVLWRGDVLYGGNRRFSIWARVSIAVKSVRLVAATTLKPAEAISAAQVRLETIETFPVAGRMASVDQVVGMIPRRLLPAGSELRRADLIGPKDISAGDSVEVEVRAGNTRLAFTGTAVTAGCVGDSISVRNPGTKKLFQAHVTGKGTALVQANGSRVY